MIHPLQYESPRPTRRPFNIRLVLAMNLATGLGCFWSFAIHLLCGVGGHPGSLLSFASAGAAGWIGGAAAIWMRLHERPRNLLLQILTTLYLGIAAFWLTYHLLPLPSQLASPPFATFQELLWLIEETGTMVLLSWLLATVPYGLIVIPLCYLSSWLIWRTYRGPDQT